MSSDGLAPRRAALWLLHGVTADGQLLSELIGGPTLAALSPADKARAQRLATETLRALGRLDHLLKRYVKKSPSAHAQNVLRLSALELCAYDEAAHGVVNAAVTLTGEHRKSAHLKGLVNAVLRKVAAEGPGLWNALPVPQIPRWLRKPLQEAYDQRSLARMELAHFKGAPLDLTVKDATEEWAAQLNGTILPTGSVRITDAPQISGLPGFEEGHWWVQDAAAALPVKILAPKAGEKVLDLCAAPGGKTLQLAAAGAKVTALDKSETRMARVTENLQRTGLTARTVVEDALAFKESGFDAILLDAPCSATGTLRRHPDLPFAKDGSEFSGLITLQSDLIDHALTLLKPGGRLVFCTCSLLPDEGECQIEDALARHDGLSVTPEALNMPGIEDTWRTEEGGLRLRPDYWPDLGGMDGFYIAALQKVD